MNAEQKARRAVAIASPGAAALGSDLCADLSAPAHKSVERHVNAMTEHTVKLYHNNGKPLFSNKAKRPANMSGRQWKKERKKQRRVLVPQSGQIFDAQE